MAKQVLVIASVISFLVYAAQSSNSKVYRVGDDYGWGPGMDYRAWTRGKTFYVGDSLEFVYDEGFSVDEVTGAKYLACDNKGSIFSADSGNTVIPLKAQGIYYFIGGAFQECSQGMNLTVTVHPS